MNRVNQILGAALVVQLVITGGVYFGNRPATADQKQMALLNTDKKTIDHITIDGGETKRLVLSKINGQWQLPDYHQLPANQGAVNKLLNSLASTKSGWPVATTASSRERFEVANDKFEKKLLLGRGDTVVQTLYLGTSPAYRQLHVRRGGENEVYAVKLNSYDFPIKPVDWLDKTLLQPKGDIANLKGPGFAFNKQAENWRLTTGKGEPIKKEIEKITNTLARLNVLAAVNKSASKSDYRLVVKAGGDTLTYGFFKDGDDRYVRRNDYSQAFKISKADYDKITRETASQLVKQTVRKEKHSMAKTKTRNKKHTKSNAKQEVMSGDKKHS